MSDYIEKVFGAGGLLQQRFPGYQPRIGQVELAMAVDEGMTSGRNVLAEAPTGCHVAGQPIMRDDGSVVLVEDVRVGDRLMGPDGKPRVVTRLAAGSQETAWVRPVKGEPWRVNLDHVLTLKHTETSEVIDVRVCDWLEWAKSRKHVWKLFRVGVEQFALTSRIEARLPIEPYALGILLGDGCFRNGVSLCKPGTVMEAVAIELAVEFGLKVRTYVNSSGCPTHHLANVKGRNSGRARNSLTQALRSLDLYGRLSADKFIPERYKVAGRVQRLALLAGLFDTDGSVSCVGYDYISKSEQLANDVAFVARSLGFAAYVKQCQKRWQNGIGEYWRLHVSGDCHLIPCRIKPVPKRLQKKDVLRTGFKVEKTGEVEPYYGFSLRGDGRYLLGDFTVTHNTGKSVGYGVPASFVAAKGQKVVIVTANIALQEQLIRKDLPLIQSIVPWKFTYAIAKGINNYLCRSKLDESLNDTTMGVFTGTQREREQWNQIVEWAQSTLSGDLSELEQEPAPALRQRFTIMAEDCAGKKCEHYEKCPAMMARTAYKKASVIVTNYSLFFIDLTIKRAGGDGLLPYYAHVVFDEGHKAADAARDFLGFSISPFGVSRATKSLDHKQAVTSKKGFLPVIDADLRKSVLRASDDFFAALKMVAASDRYAVRFKRAWEGNLLKTSKPLADYLDRTSVVLSEAATSPGLTEERAQELQRFAGTCAQYANNIRSASEYQTNEWVYFIEENDDRVTLKGLPVKVAPFLREQLFECKTGTHAIKSVTVTSATLATDVDNFDYIAEQLGMEDAEQLSVLSPFDLAKCVTVVCPPMPDPNAKNFGSSVASRIIDVLEQSQGRALCLFTSYRVMNEVHALVKNEVPFTIYKQGELPRLQLIERFKTEVSSVLFGTESFWAGVDIPGESLSVVIIDKLPFPNISDPIQDVLKSRDDRGYFMKHSVPAAVIAFRQGSGRLIRTDTDRGVIVVLDCRITEKGYGKTFIRAFPTGVRVTRDLGEVAYFLNGK